MGMPLTENNVAVFGDKVTRNIKRDEVIYNNIGRFTSRMMMFL